MTAQLIKWNELRFFEGFRAKIGEFLRIKALREGAFSCLNAFVSKEMTKLEKLALIKQSGYLEEVRDATYNHLMNYEDNYGSHDYDEEKSFMIVVSTSVCQIAKWCVEINGPPGSAEEVSFPD